MKSDVNLNIRNFEHYCHIVSNKEEFLMQVWARIPDNEGGGAQPNEDVI